MSLHWFGGGQVGLFRAEEVDPYWASVKLLLSADGSNNSTTIPDSSPAAVGNMTVNGDAKLTTSQAKFGPSSVAFDGTGDYIVTPNYSPVIALAGGPFTQEGWFRVADTGVTRGICGIWDNAATPVGWYVYRSSGNKLVLFIGNSSSGFNRITGTTTISANTWYHFAHLRDASAQRLYLEGNLEGSYNSSPGGVQNWDATINARNVRIGSYDGAVEFFSGQIDEVRFTAGVARYPNASFTPRTTAFPHG